MLTWNKPIHNNKIMSYLNIHVLHTFVVGRIFFLHIFAQEYPHLKNEPTSLISVESHYHHDEGL